MPSSQTGFRGVVSGYILRRIKSRERGHSWLPGAPRRRGLGAGLAGRLLGTPDLRLRRGGSMTGAEGLGPAVPCPPSGLGDKGWRPGKAQERPRRVRCLHPPWVQKARLADSLPAFFKTRILRLPVAASGAERLRGRPMRAQTERLTAAVIGGRCGAMADRR